MSTRIPLKSILSNLVILALSLAGPGVTGLAYAAGGNNECPVGLVNGQTLNEESGEGTSELTRCISRRHDVELLVQVNRYCGNSGCTRAYALHNIYNVIADFQQRGYEYVQS